MVHITTRNLPLVDVDLLISECLRCSRNESGFVYLISPFMADFRIPDSFLRFASNVVNVSDVEYLSDLIGLILYYGGKAYIVTRAPSELRNSNLSQSFVNRQARFLATLHNIGCSIRINRKIHAKLYVTSQGAISGSFNLTKSGRFANIEQGDFFPNQAGVPSEAYLEKLAWAKKLYENDSRSLEDEDLDTIEKA